jgi:COP9 signalosome complex subunit 1
MGHNDLGDFYYEMGDLALALKSFAQARDYCTTDKHIIDMCFNVIKVEWNAHEYGECTDISNLKYLILLKVAIHMSNFVHVSNYLLRLEQVASTSSDVM